MNTAAPGISPRKAKSEHPVTKKPVPPKFLGGGTPAIPADDEDRRARSGELDHFAAESIFRARHREPDLARIFRPGIVEPFDDFRSTNPPTNRELLDAPGRHFIDSGFRLKALHRVILNSARYQLSSDIR